MGPFAKTIMERKYSHTQPDGTKETWSNIAYRTTKHVMRSVGVTMRESLARDIKWAIEEKKFIPAGRYLYASGNPKHQVCNCFNMKVHDSREGWSELLHNASMALMMGGGIGVNYSDIRHEGALIRKTGGIASGPLPLIQIVNEIGRGIIQGGDRRSAIWGGLSWKHPDIHKFIRIKNWPDEVHALKAKDFSFPAMLDQTNISVCLDDEFFDAYADNEHVLHGLAHSVYWAVVEQSLRTGEPAFSVDVGKNRNEDQRNAPLSADTHVLTSDGYKQIRSLVEHPVTLWTGKQWAHDVVFRKTASNVQTLEVSCSGGRCIKADPDHEFFVERWGPGPEGRCKNSKVNLLGVDKVAAKNLKKGDVLNVQLPSHLEGEIYFDSYYYTLGFIYGDGSLKDNGSADLSLCTEEKRSLRQYMESPNSLTSPTKDGHDRLYFKAGTFNYQKPIPPPLPIHLVPSFLAGLFDADGSYDQEHQYIRLSATKEVLESVRRMLECLGIVSGISKAGKSGYTGKQCYLLSIMASSIVSFQRLIPTKRLNIKADNYVPYRTSRVKVLEVVEGPVEDVYCCDVKVPEHSFVAEGVVVSNCCEFTSKDSDNACNLGSLNFARIESLEELEYIIEIATAFLLAGTVYTQVPYSAVDKVISKRREIGLGIMGLHEWLLTRGLPYGPDPVLGEWLATYARSGKPANEWADEWGLKHPRKTRAIAPNGTTAIVAETTGGIEPIFCVAYKRRYLKGSTHCYQYVVDPVARRLIQSGISPDSIEDAYTLAQNPERRIAFQAWVQQYVDHGISSTVNLPQWGSEWNNQDLVRPFGDMLMKYLPRLRGVTCYPDASRMGQPLTPVPYSEAIKGEGIEVVEEQQDVCSLRGGNCGD